MSFGERNLSIDTCDDPESQSVGFGRKLTAICMLLLAMPRVGSDVPMSVPEVPACMSFADSGSSKDAEGCIADMTTDTIALVDLRKDPPGDTIAVSRVLQDELNTDSGGLLDVSITTITATEETRARANEFDCVDMNNPSTIGPVVVRKLMYEDVAEYDKIITINSLPECSGKIAGIARSEEGDAQLFAADNQTPERIIRDAEHEIMHLYRLWHADVLRRNSSNQEEALEKYRDSEPQSVLKIALSELFNDTTSARRGEGDAEHFNLSQGGQYGAIMGQPSDEPLNDRLPNAQLAVLGYPYEVANGRQKNVVKVGDQPRHITPQEAYKSVASADINFTSPHDGRKFSQLLITPAIYTVPDSANEVIVGASIYLANGRKGEILKLGDVYKSNADERGVSRERQTYEFEVGGTSVSVSFEGQAMEIASQR